MEQQDEIWSVILSKLRVK